MHVKKACVNHTSGRSTWYAAAWSSIPYQCPWHGVGDERRQAAHTLRYHYLRNHPLTNTLRVSLVQSTHASAPRARGLLWRTRCGPMPRLTMGNISQQAVKLRGSCTFHSFQCATSVQCILGTAWFLFLPCSAKLAGQVALASLETHTTPLPTNYVCAFYPLEISETRSTARHLLRTNHAQLHRTKNHGVLQSPSRGNSDGRWHGHVK